MSTQKRKRIRRSNTVSQATMNKRMREIWIDGYGLLPTGATPKQVTMTRNALRSLVDDGDYWDGLMKLSALKAEVNELMTVLKSIGRWDNGR